ncbi:MAG TPA: hypothetical protein VMR43_14645 [Variovorax sp.]|nr:hypothetical protein [Variovorax sp.]
MTQTPSNAALLEDALAAIREVMARMERRPPPAPSAMPAAVTGRSDDPAPTVEVISPAQQIALHHYLASASLLLDASLMLIRQPAQRSLLERSRQWSALIQQTKAAGRMVYGAALALADPGSMPSPPPAPAPRA